MKKIGNGNLIVFLLTAFVYLFSVGESAADIVRYVDDSGKVHYTSAPDKVPEEYREQLKNQKPLPPINKVPSRSVSPSGDKKYSSTSTSSTVEVFVASWCPYCQKLEDFLRKSNIRYRRYDIDKSKRGRKMYQQLGGGGVPVTRIGSRVIKGYNPDAIRQVLNQK